MNYIYIYDTGDAEQNIWFNCRFVGTWLQNVDDFKAWSKDKKMRKPLLCGW